MREDERNHAVEIERALGDKNGGECKVGCGSERARDSESPRADAQNKQREHESNAYRLSEQREDEVKLSSEVSEETA